MRTAIYTRISDDREGRGLGVARQEADCRDLAARRGWTVTEVFPDNDVSATAKRKRPEYERMLDAIEAGDIDAVVVWDIDRLTRRPAELEKFIDLAERHGVQLASVGGEIDLATPQGRLTARIKGSVARHEAEQIQRRIMSKVEELAADGKIANGGPRPFGYRRVYAGEGNRRKILRDEVDPAEAAIVRDCAERVLAGEPLRSIVRDLNARNILTSTGKLWSQQALRGMLRSGRIAGLREHNGVVVGKAVWPAITTVEQHQQLRALLDAKERPVGSRVRKHYLSGLVFCSDCVKGGVRMRVGTQHGNLKYKCMPDTGGCNGRVIGLDDLQDLVDRYVVARLGDRRLLEELARRDNTDDAEAKRLLAEIDADERRLGLLQAALTNGDMDEMPEVLATVRNVRKRLARTHDQLARLAAVPSSVRQAVGVDLDQWRAFDLDAKRACLRFFVAQILIAPATRGRATFDPSRVGIVAA
ncbi:recombinase family protein [Micromonospora chersina]|uniref:recombinase family protein n=1 Tax=Micromonospora chersina TaxID=47854 RepID=UPI00367CA12F